jgi:hypothetical protein
MEPKHQLAAEMLRDTLAALCPFPENAAALHEAFMIFGLDGETAFMLAYEPYNMPLGAFIAAADLLGAKLLLSLPDSADAKVIAAALSGLRTAPDGAAN